MFSENVPTLQLVLEKILISALFLFLLEYEDAKTPDQTLQGSEGKEPDSRLYSIFFIFSLCSVM